MVHEEAVTGSEELVEVVSRDPLTASGHGLDSGRPEPGVAGQQDAQHADGRDGAGGG
jgi:hypothetical protein